MKAVIRFLLVFLSGVVAGYFLAQEPVRARLKVVLQDGWVGIQEQAARLKNHFYNDDKPAVSSPASSSNPSAPVQPTSQDRGAYIRQSVAITNIQGKPDSASPQAAIVSGSIQNNGNRPLNRVEVSLYFIDKDNIFFEARVPVLSDTLLPAGQTHNFSVRVTGIPAPGVKSKIRASIIDIAFGD